MPDVNYGPSGNLVRAEKSVFVTGGTGFVGSHLVEELICRGYSDIRCLVRNRLKWLEGLPIRQVTGGTDNIEALKEGCREVDYVYHVAGLTRSVSEAAFYRANVEGTLNLLNVVREEAPDVQKLLVTSSMAAAGPSLNGAMTEDEGFHPISEYGRSKAEMERKVQAYMDALPIVIVRPAAVYGPREVDIYGFFRTVNYGICPIIGRGTAPQLSLVHVDDVVRGMVDAAESDKTAGRTYFLGSQRFYSWDEVREATLSAAGRRALTIRIPRRLVSFVGAAVEDISRLFGSYPPLNREKAREIQASWLCSVERAQKDFGYEQRVALEDGIESTLAWYRREKWL